MIQDDEFESPIKDDGLQRDEESAPSPRRKGAPAPSLGYILDTKNPKKVARHIIQLREDQAAAISRDRATWTRNRWWREGRRFVRLDKRQDNNQWRAVLPSGMGNAPPVPNRTDRMCRRLGNSLLVDKPIPECLPAGDTAEARESAEFASRYLKVKSDVTELNIPAELRAALDKSQTYASAFSWVQMDPGGGGHRPRSLLAHPAAQTEEDATADPETRLEAPDEELTERYLRPDGTLTDDADEADLQWLPGHRLRLLTGLQGRFLPATARGLRYADGFHITDFTTLGDLRRQFPDAIEALTTAELTTLCTWRPDHVEDILPPYTDEPEDCKEEGKAGGYTDKQVVFVTTVYYGRCSEYPKGCYAVVGGKSLLLHRDTWTAKFPVGPGPDGAPRPEQTKVLRIPVAQLRCLDDNTNDNGMGIGIAEHMGPADEISASALGFELEHMFRAGNPHTFLPIGSIVQPKQLQLRNGTPIMTNPQGKPEVEQVPPLSATIPMLREEMQRDQDDASGLQQAAQGVEGPTVKSGVHAQTIVQEALKAVSNMKENAEEFYVTLLTVILEQTRAFCALPTILEFTGPDGEYKAKEFTRTDFGTTEKVSIAKGSFTMHTLLAKQEMANNALDRKAIDVDQYNDLISGGLSPILGIQDNPDLLRVRNQIEVWKEGPSPEWMQAYTASQQQYQMAIAANQEGMRQAAGLASLGIAPDPATVPAAPSGPPPLPPGAFERLPIDLEPMAAKIRHRQLRREMATLAWRAKPDPWRQSFIEEYTQMANAAGIMTVPQVQAAKAAAEAAAPPALPHGVTIAMKGDASTVAAEEKAALGGFPHPAGPAGAPAPVSPEPAQAPAGV